MLRTHTCGQLRRDDVGSDVTLCGWVDRIRDHSGVLFVDLRDRYGKSQIVFSPEGGDDLQRAARQLRGEYVVRVTGQVALRPEETANPKLATGEIEVRATAVELVNRSQTPPVSPSSQELAGEDLRLKHRYLDLRRPEMQSTLILRDAMIKAMRDYFAGHGFIDVETPVLGRSTPEGARDYLVPSRIHPGAFYALPQSPQLYKQILMVAGYDRYVQVARCFRDEDLRADRQPEFTQLDMEMSFVDADDVMNMIDGLVATLAGKFLATDVPLPLPRMTYDEAMDRYGCDAPDLRYGLSLVNCTDLAAECEFRVFQSNSGEGRRVRGINACGAADRYSRKGIDELTEFVRQDFGAQGLAWFKVDADGRLASPIAKNFTASMLGRFAERFQARPGDLLLLVADTVDVTNRALAGLRRRLGTELQLVQPGQLHFSWIVEFPMFEYDDTQKRWTAVHHPFTAPRAADVPYLQSDPGACRARAYDLVINGYEAGGGTVRIHDPKLQSQVFQVLGIDDIMAQQRFGFLLEALQYGAPPHAGIALGIDRLVMLFGMLDNIRDCMAFPKTQRATDLMTQAPGPVDAQQLRELRIRIEQG